MNGNVMIIAALLLLPAVGLVAWAWFAMARIEDDLRAIGNFEGMHFDIGPEAAAREASTWRTHG